MFDKYNRQINYLRISVTDRCNLRCTYCMPEEGVDLLQHNDILSFEEILEIVKVSVDLGISKIRITGGEPLVRKGIEILIEKIASIKGIKDLALTTNGILLKQKALLLKNAGLNRVNVSLDTLDKEKYKAITRGGEVFQVVEGIEAAISVGLSPIKLNCVVFHSSNERDALEVKAFAQKYGLQVRFIRQMNLETGEFSIVEGGMGGNCSQCNRLRLTAKGMMKPCLFDEHEYSVRELGVENAIMKALNAKPIRGCFNKTGTFYGIGG
jgi:GTP 3',8-cyclase